MINIDEQAVHGETHELLSKIAIDGRAAVVTELLNEAKLVTDADEHLRIVRRAVELDEHLRHAAGTAEQLAQVGAWLGRHGHRAEQDDGRAHHRRP